MLDTQMICKIRNEIGSSGCNRVRTRGHVPGIIYGRNSTNLAVELDRIELNRVVRNHGENALVNVIVDNNNYSSMIKEIQRDPVTKEIIHIDLQQVDAEEKIRTAIPILLSGRQGVDRDGILQHQLKKVEVECYPQNIPKFVSVDVSNLGIGNALKISDVEFSEDMTILNDGDEIIVSLTAPKAEEEVEEEDIIEENYWITETNEKDTEEEENDLDSQ